MGDRDIIVIDHVTNDNDIPDPDIIIVSGVRLWVI